jgi:hypothetical protein
MPLTFPTIHLNGTSADSLNQGWCDAYNAISGAIEALQQACPNERDYYLQQPGAFKKARNEHIARIRKLEAVQLELVELTENVYSQQAHDLAYQRAWATALRGLRLNAADRGSVYRDLGRQPEVKNREKPRERGRQTAVIGRPAQPGSNATLRRQDRRNDAHHTRSAYRLDPAGSGRRPNRKGRTQIVFAAPAQCEDRRHEADRASNPHAKETSPCAER